MATVLMTTALHCEAKGLIRAYRLKRRETRTAFACYDADGMSLLVTGVGKCRMAATTGALLHAATDLDDVVALNIGIAAGKNRGEVFLVNRIVDAASEREFYPDILLRTELPERTVMTHDRIVAAHSGQNLADMEAAGFYEAASMFLPPHRIGCIKVVSDLGDGNKVRPKEVEALFDVAADQIQTAVDLYRSMPVDRIDPLDADGHEIVNELADALRLTVTQRHELFDLARGYVLRHEKLPDFASFVREEVDTKEQGKRLFESIRHILAE